MKKSLKKIISLVLCLTMILSVGVISVSAEEEVTTDCGGNCEYYPTIIVPGLGQSNTWVTDENGTPITDDEGNKITSFPAYLNLSEIIKTVALPLIMSLFSQSDAGLSEAVGEVIWQCFGINASDENGKLTGNVITEKYLYSVADSNTEEQEKVFSHVPFNIYETEQPFDHMYYFGYNSFGNHLEIVDELYDYIQLVKAQTGHDKVNLVPLSQGGTLTSGLIEYYPEISKDLHKIIFVVPALDGSTIIGDVFNGRTAFLDADYLYNGFLENLGLLDERTARIVEIALRVLPDEVIMKVLETAVDVLVSDVMITSTNLWALCPSGDYPTAAKKYLSAPEMAEIKRQTDIYYQAQLDCDENILGLVEDGVQVFCFCEYDFPMINVGTTWNTQNADYIIQTDSTSMGAYFANVGETLPGDYVQQNTHCDNPDHDHISPDRVVDASAGLLPDTTFYFDAQRHDLTAHNDIILKLALELIARDDVKDVYSSPDFPQFLAGRNILNIKALIETAAAVDTAKLSNADATELEAALTGAKEVLTRTVSYTGELEEREARLNDILVKIGVVEAAEESDPTLFRNISLWLYEKFGTNGFSEIPKVALGKLFDK